MTIRIIKNNVNPKFLFKLIARKQYFEKCKNFNVQDFSKIIFSDESTFRLLNEDAGSSYYKKASQKRKNLKFKNTKKFGGGSVMVWDSHQKWKI